MCAPGFGEQGMGALGLGGSAAAGIGGSRDGGGAAPMTDGRAASLPSSLGEALQRAQLAQLHQQLAAGARSVMSISARLKAQLVTLFSTSVDGMTN